jgi:hypothetical protein
MPADLSWLVDKSLQESEKKDYSWFFIFSGSGSISTESPWRLLNAERIVVTSEDHGHPFGLKEPIDAAIRVRETIKEKKVVAYLIRERTSDLIVKFEDDICLEFLQLSCGYEAWRACHPGVEVICLGGGGVEVFKDEKNRS